MLEPHQRTAWRRVRIGLACTWYAVAFAPVVLPLALIVEFFGGASLLWIAVWGLLYVAGQAQLLAVPDARARLAQTLSLFCLPLLTLVGWLSAHGSPPSVPDRVFEAVLLLSAVAASGGHVLLSVLALRRIATCLEDAQLHTWCALYLAGMIMIPAAALPGYAATCVFGTKQSVLETVTSMAFSILAFGCLLGYVMYLFLLMHFGERLAEGLTPTATEPERPA